MTRVVVAVSGGVDSVVLLDMVVRGRIPKLKKVNATDIVVAHFDHGIRGDSALDAEFVRTLAKQHGVAFETKREELGKDASEELARNRRYAFLRSLAQKYNAPIVTAHHADDVVETVAINIQRGTGWRGLAVLDSPDIQRPLLAFRKSQLLAYAKEQSLQWREDSTNHDTKYLRNDLRNQLVDMNDDDCRLMGLYRNRQVALKHMIDEEAARIVGGPPYSRYFFISIPEQSAVELLRTMFVQAAGQSPTIPMRKRALHAIKAYAAGRRYEVGEGLVLKFTKTSFAIETKNTITR